MDTEPAPAPSRLSRFADGGVSLAFMALGLYMTAVSITRYNAFTEGQVGPGVLPFLIGLTMVLTSGLVLWRLRSGVLYEGEMPSGGELLRMLGLLALTTACVLLIPIAGTIVTLGAFILVETAVLERRTWPVSLAATMIIPLLLYVFFEALLGVPLPAGRLGLL